MIESVIDWSLRNRFLVLLASAGIVVGGYYLAKLARAAQQLLADGDERQDFLRDKITIAQFYAEQILPTAAGYGPAATGGASLFYAIPSERL